MNLRKGQIVSESELDAAVYALVRQAAAAGMIPIVGMISRRIRNRHEILGFGWNQLRAGIPGIHGETGAIINMGRRREGYGGLVVTSSLSPCPFCQSCLAVQMGIREIRILDAVNYTPNFSGYANVNITPIVKNHAGIVKTFSRWMNDATNATIWERDIGIYRGRVSKPFDVRANRTRTKQLVELALVEARVAGDSGEAPIGALVIDPQGEVIGAGRSEVKKLNDPSRVAAMSAWRACGARDQWKDKTLLLTAGPDHIAHSMFYVFNFGQLIVVGGSGYAGRTDDIRKLKIPVHEIATKTNPLRGWTSSNAWEYLGY